MITDDNLREIMPNLAAAKRAEYLPFLQQAMGEFNINTALREAAFLAQIAHESGEFRWMEEIWGPTAAQKNYEPPNRKARELGNTQVGDGRRYKGRGPIQITGRSNYEKYGNMLGIDIVNNPERAATPEVGFRTAALYWQKNGCNELADQQDFVTITKKINGGTNGLEDRKKYYNRALRVLGIAVRSLPTSRGSNEPVTRAFTRGLDSSDEVTPTAAERNASEAEEAASTGKSAGGKKAGAKKGVNKSAKSAAKSSSKKSPGKSSAAKKGVAKKASAKKASAKKASARAGAKKTGSSKSAAKKSSGSKSAAKKSSAKKGGAKKSSTKKSTRRSSKG